MPNENPIFHVREHLLKGMPTFFVDELFIHLCE